MAARDRLVDLDAVTRLHDRDASLFSEDAAAQESVANRLGWTRLSRVAAESLPGLEGFARMAVDENVTDVVLLGMGGSSLAALVIGKVIDPEKVRLHVLDTVSPVTVGDALGKLDPASTLYVVSSKSGGTIEPNTLYAVFRAHADEVLGRSAAGQRFIAVTDPGSSLEKLAAAEGFRETLWAPVDVGGRFSALTVFGLVPAALIGVDARRLIERAASAEHDCAKSAEENPAVELASFIADAHDAGADKLTIVASKKLRSFGLWVEQLVAESLGKQGTGIVPVVALTERPRGLGADRALVVVRMTGEAYLAEWAQEQRGSHAVYEIVLDDPYDIAEEFVRWEYAVALCGVLLGVNPFDEPNVAEAKAATAAVLEGSVEAPVAHGSANDVIITFAGGLPDPGHAERAAATAVGHAIAALKPGDYLALLAYLPDDDALLAPLEEVCVAVSEATGAAVCLELGPRYLHSTGQLHKGGPNTGVFIMVNTRDGANVEVPGQTWSLRALHVAQAEGDLVTLAAHGRRVLRLEIADASPESIEQVVQALAYGAGAVTEGLTAR